MTWICFLHYWPFVGGSIVLWWMPLTKGQWCTAQYYSMMTWYCICVRYKDMHSIHPFISIFRLRCCPCPILFVCQGCWRLACIVFFITSVYILILIICSEVLIYDDTTAVFTFNSSSSGQNGCHFVDDIIRCIFVNEKFCIFIKMSLKFVPMGPIDNNPALVKIMAWCQIGDKPLSEPMLTWSNDDYIWH